MNQILLTDDSNININNDTGNYNDYNNNPKKPIDIQKIIMIFGAIIIVFGVVLAGIYGFKALSKKGPSEGQNSGQNASIADIVLEEIDLTEVGDEDIREKKEVYVNIPSGLEIESVVYTWNDSEAKEATADAEGKYSISIPAGTNELLVKVTDKNGQEKELRQSFTVKNEDQKPKIEATIVESGKLKIVATSTIPMKYVKYSWENEDEITIEPETGEEDRIETVIEVKRGKNKLTIIAVDHNENREIIEKTFNGVNNPEIKVTKKGDKIHLKVSHDKGLKKVIFSINDRVFTYDSNVESYDPDKTLLEYYFKLKTGENVIIIKAISNEDSVQDYKGKCKYNP